MLTLTLLRHAKSSWEDPGLDDHERPLNKRGLRDAPQMGRWIAGQLGAGAVSPSLILCSDAARTRATLALVLPLITTGAPGRKSRKSPEVLVERSLYLAEPLTLLARIRAVGKGTTSLMLIGHNPGLHLLAQILAGDGPSDAMAHLARGFPTSAAAIITFDAASFSSIDADRGTLIAMMSPKRLG